MKPLIGITQRVVENVSYPEIRDALAQDWYRFAESCGFVPVPLPNHKALIFDVLQSVPFKGIILSGGNDIGSYLMRDEAESFLLQHAIDRAVPVIGICRGMQMMQEFSGGFLARVPRHVGVRHDLVCESVPRGVNSFHEFSVQKPAAGFHAIAYADDGTVEAMRHESRKWLGMMWHPEREDHIHPQDQQFFKEMFGL
jgi:gamma-glutamyl-gamma-aminobutyrate hydrolase PuuD